MDAISMTADHDAAPGRTQVVDALVNISGREVSMTASCRLLPAGVGITGAVGIKIPAAFIPPELLDLATIPPDDGGDVILPLCRWSQFADDDADDTTQELASVWADLVLREVFALQPADVRRTVLRLAQEALHRAFVADLTQRDDERGG